MSGEVITDADRYPNLSPDGAKLLHFMREHPHAPIFRNESGHRLQEADLVHVQELAQRVRAARIDWRPDEPPGWVEAFVANANAHVPFYRSRAATGCFESLPTINRGDLSEDIAAFYPDNVPIDRIINFRTSGTTGHPLLLASHPRVAGSYLAFHLRAMDRFGIKLEHGRGRIGVVLVGYQEKCFTYVSVTPLMDESGLAKLNLHPVDWRDPADRAAYLDALNPEVYTGDPLSLAELMKLPLRTKPRAMLSTSMTLTPELRDTFSRHFGCPVLDLYSMNEAGPVAVADPSAGGHVLLQPDLFVEILDPAGRRLPPGERGEVALTGGFNFCLPLVRYRTGDQASLRFGEHGPVLVELEGRPPVRFRTPTGVWRNNIEVTHVLRPFALSQWTLHQEADGTFVFRSSGGGGNAAALRSALESVLEKGAVISIEENGRFEGKVVQYTTALAG